MTQEVVRPGILVQAAKQVSDGVDEILLPCRGGVEEEVAGQFEQGPPLGVRHPFEHLDLNPVRDAGLCGQ